MQALRNWVRVYRWPLVMLFVVLAGSSLFVWLWRQGVVEGQAAAERPDAAAVEALQRLQEQNNELQAALQRAQTAAPATHATAATPVSGSVNINTASTAELDSLPGIGPSKAAAIIEYRTTHGGFRTTRELLNVKGIGDSTFEALEDLITVS